jgi:polysaccharide chain length determinant protein (PEP-CTERM system associated)
VLPRKQYSPLDFAHMAWRRRGFIVVPFVACFLVTLIVSSRLPNQYQSETLIQVVPQQVPDAYVQSTVTIRTEDRLNALRQQVMSRTELERLIVEFNLFPEERARLPMQDVVELVRERAVVDPVLSLNNSRPDAEAFHIRFTYHDAATSARVTERLGSLFIDQNARDRGALADTTDDFLKTQLAEARKSLELQEQRLEQFRVQHAGRLPSQLQFNMQAIQNTQLQLQSLVESLARDRDRKLMLERLHNDSLQTDPVAIQQDTAPTPAGPIAEAADLQRAGAGSAQQQLALAQALLSRLETRLKPEHPDIIRVKRQVRDLEQAAAKEAARPEGAPSLVPTTPQEVLRRERLQQQRAEIESLDRQIVFKEGEERRLRGIVSDYQTRIEAVPGIESEWVSLTRDYDTQQDAYNALLSKSQQAKVAANLERRQVGEQFRILDAARIPDRPITPVRRTITVGGAAAGLLLGLMLAALMEVRDTTFRTDRDIVEVLALPVVAVVPAIESDADKRRKRRRQILMSSSAVAASVVAGLVFWSLELWRYLV